ncbi:MAG: type 4a pilus biogenesis protein PilO [Candidatus Omnitrophica bacterium]|nr:type 4a pilus biogenesis protein PilO [Candidatus Omnitrophota bacterium]
MGGLPTIPAGRKKILFGVLAAVGTVLWANFLLMPQWAQWSRQGQELKSLERQVEQARRQLAQLPGVERNSEQLSTQLAIRSSDIPPQEQLPELMDQIAQMARASRLRLSSLKPGAEISGLSPGPSGYLEVPIEVVTSAGYHQVGAFLDALESSEHLLRVQSLEIIANNQDMWNHRVRIILQAYLPPAGER